MVYSHENGSSGSSRTTIQQAPMGDSLGKSLEQIESLDPALAPAVTLLSVHSRRKYHGNYFKFLHELKPDGKPADKIWKEVYGNLIGTQLAIYDASKVVDLGAGQLKYSEKPIYINFTDSSFQPLSIAGDNNTMVVATTLKNRYLLQFSTSLEFNTWHSIFRLSTFEYTSLQEAYTASLLSSKGAKLNDISVLLAESKFKHEEWISVRFGSGMPWKRCYAVVSPPEGKSSKKKGLKKGKIQLYENQKKSKKGLIATIVDASAAYAIYPEVPVLIDSSTIIKIEGSVVFNTKEPSTDSSIFIMPEQHPAVMGYETLIRFLIPIFDSFHLYGRPKHLIANKTDINSLLFGLPVLPKAEYLEPKDLDNISFSTTCLTWSPLEWRMQIKLILKDKVDKGYQGCGSLAASFAQEDSFQSPPPVLTPNPNSHAAPPLTPSYLPTPVMGENTHTDETQSSNLSPKPQFQNPSNLLPAPQSQLRPQYGNARTGGHSPLSEIYMSYRRSGVNQGDTSDENEDNTSLHNTTDTNNENPKQVIPPIVINDHDTNSLNEPMRGLNITTVPDNNDNKNIIDEDIFNPTYNIHSRSINDEDDGGLTSPISDIVPHNSGSTYQTSVVSEKEKLQNWPSNNPIEQNQGQNIDEPNGNINNIIVTKVDYQNGRIQSPSIAKNPFPPVVNNHNHNLDQQQRRRPPPNPSPAGQYPPSHSQGRPQGPSVPGQYPQSQGQVIQGVPQGSSSQPPPRRHPLHQGHEGQGYHQPFDQTQQYNPRYPGSPPQQQQQHQNPRVQQQHHHQHPHVQQLHQNQNQDPEYQQRPHIQQRQSSRPRPYPNAPDAVPYPTQTPLSSQGMDGMVPMASPNGQRGHKTYRNMLI